MPKYAWNDCLACGVRYLGRRGSKFCSRYCFETNPHLVNFSRGEEHWHYSGEHVSSPGVLEAYYGEDIDFREAYAIWRSVDTGDYIHFHGALTLSRGKASENTCYACEESIAKERAWLHDTDFRDFDNYVALCITCHRFYDKES